MRATLLLFFFCAQLHATKCIVALRARVERTYIQAELKRFFSKQESPPFIAIGVLLQLPSGEKALVLGDYFGNFHNGLLNSFGISNVASNHDANAGASSKKVKILWGGELLFEKVGDEFYPITANHTSGSIQNASQGRTQYIDEEGYRVEVVNQSEHLANFLDANGIQKKENLKQISYTSDNKHFLDVKIPDDETLRHDLNNRLQVILTNLQSLKSLTRNQRTSPSEQIEILSDIHSEFNKRVLGVLAHIKKMYAKRNPDVLNAISTFENFYSLTKDPLAENEIATFLSDDFISKNIEATLTINRVLSDKTPMPDTEENTIFVFSGIGLIQ